MKMKDLFYVILWGVLCGFALFGIAAGVIFSTHWLVVKTAPPGMLKQSEKICKLVQK